MSLRTNFVVIAAVAVLSGCGDEPTDRAATTAPTASPVPTQSAAPTAAPTITVTPTPTIPPATEDEGGDEGGNRIDLHFDLYAEDVQPARIEVPAFLGLRIRVRNQSGRERIVRMRGEPVLELLPAQSDTALVEGLRPGEHLLEAGESGRATIVALRAGG